MHIEKNSVKNRKKSQFYDKNLIYLFFEHDGDFGIIINNTHP